MSQILKFTEWFFKSTVVPSQPSQFAPGHCTPVFAMNMPGGEGARHLAYLIDY
jgi:hypothetical protein